MTATSTARPPAARAAATARPRTRPAPQPAPSLRVVAANDAVARLRRRRGVAWLSLTLLAAGLLAIVTSHVLLSQQQHELENLEQQAAQSQRRYDQLRLEVARLEAPERVVEVATQRLGMVAPEKVTYLTPTERVVEPTSVDANAVEAAKRDGDAPLDEEQAVSLVGGSGWSSVKPHLTAAP